MEAGGQNIFRSRFISGVIGCIVTFYNETWQETISFQLIKFEAAYILISSLFLPEKFNRISRMEFVSSAKGFAGIQSETHYALSTSMQLARYIRWHVWRGDWCICGIGHSCVLWSNQCIELRLQLFYFLLLCITFFIAAIRLCPFSLIIRFMELKLLNAQIGAAESL
jgi:hypothetical protein